MDCSTSLCFVMMLWTARAKLSVPPPGPAVAMNSIGFAGCQAALTAPGPQIARAQPNAANFGIRDIGFSLELFLEIVWFVIAGFCQLTLSGTRSAAAIAPSA